MKEYMAKVAVLICGDMVPMGESGWFDSKAKEEDEAMYFVEQRMPAGLYRMGTVFYERNV